VHQRRPPRSDGNFPTVHVSAFEKVRAFRNAYLTGSERVFEIGSGSDAEAPLTLRRLFPTPFDYVGLDIEPGPNVDFVPVDPYHWVELASESMDVVVSNSTFEHIPMFWITAAEIARVLRPRGLVCIVAPSGGRVHRYPVDCWRFYPDSWAALSGYVGLELVESYREYSNWRIAVPGIRWGDAMMVARKPTLADEVARKAYYDHLEAIVATRLWTTTVPSVGPGPAARLYEQSHTSDKTDLIRHPWNVRHVLPPPKRWPGAPRVRRALNRRNEERALERGKVAMPWPSDTTRP
jgi:SAM-dependent methyltransferase